MDNKPVNDPVGFSCWLKYIFFFVKVVKEAVVYFSCSDCSEDRARETLERVMSQALLKARRRRSNVCAVCLAVAGVNHPIDQQRMLDWLRLV